MPSIISQFCTNNDVMMFEILIRGFTITSNVFLTIMCICVFVVTVDVYCACCRLFTKSQYTKSDDDDNVQHP